MKELSGFYDSTKSITGQKKEPAAHDAAGWACGTSALLPLFALGADAGAYPIVIKTVDESHPGMLGAGGDVTLFAL